MATKKVDEKTTLTQNKRTMKEINPIRQAVIDSATCNEIKSALTQLEVGEIVVFSKNVRDSVKVTAAILGNTKGTIGRKYRTATLENDVFVKRVN